MITNELHSAKIMPLRF